MGRAVLLSIQPKWCELIASGKKTVEVRKTKPKLETPFKCYIYETLGEKIILSNVCKGAINRDCGKVIGEFVCDAIYTIEKDSYGWFYGKGIETIGIGYAEEVDDLFLCIPDKELMKYLGSKVGYGWHISDLVIYNEPRELSELKRACPDNVYDCAMCRHSDYTGMRCTPITRPPQSWCYVDALWKEKENEPT